MKPEIIKRILSSVVLIPIALFFIIKKRAIGISTNELNILLIISGFIKYYQNFF